MALPGTLDSLRVTALRRTMAALATVDPTDIDATWPSAASVIFQTLTDVQAKAGVAVEVETARQLLDAVQMELGWDLTGIVTASESPARLAGRLAATPRLLNQRVAGGMTPADAWAQVSAWHGQLAGSVVHETARGGGSDVATSHPGFSGWRWIPEGGACAWCRSQASRGAVFHTNAKHSHGHCHCHVAEVTDRAEAKRIHDDGAAAWKRMKEAGEVPPKWRTADMPAAPGSPLTRPGARTPQRLAAIDAQIASYQRSLPRLDPASHAARWQEQKLSDLRVERSALRGPIALPAIERLSDSRITSAERAALSDYQTTAFVRMNDVLRAGEAAEGRTAKRIAALDGLMTRSAIPTDGMTLYRGIDDKANFGLGDLLVGDAMLDLGFMSTSSSAEIARHFTWDRWDSALLEIYVPGGARGLVLGGDQAEVLIDRGSAVRITAISGDAKGRLHIQGRLEQP